MCCSPSEATTWTRANPHNVQTALIAMPLLPAE
jgi:hypothetical protein